MARSGRQGPSSAPGRMREILLKARYKAKNAAKKPMFTERVKAAMMECTTLHLH